MTEHRLAHILRAIADGKIVQYQTPTGGVWTDFNPDIHSLPLNSNHLTWRIKPKPKVKKWRWVFEDLSGYLYVTKGHYESAEEASSKYRSVKFIEPVQTTMIEVEEDDE